MQGIASLRKYSAKAFANLGILVRRAHRAMLKQEGLDAHGDGRERNLGSGGPTENS